MLSRLLLWLAENAVSAWCRGWFKPKTIAEIQAKKEAEPDDPWSATVKKL